MKTGTIKFFNVDKGYGFIKVDGTGEEIFVHSTGLVANIDKKKLSKEGCEVEFEIGQGKKGEQAINVDIL